VILKLDYYWEKVKRDNDISAFEWIYKNIFKSLCFYVFHITGDQFLSEEVVQETLVKIWNERDKLIITGNFKSYVYQSVHNLAINKLVQQNTLKFSVNKPVTSEVWQLIANNFSYNAFLIEKLEAQDTENIINSAVEKLPEQCRIAFKLSKYENKTNEEIANALNISVNTVRSQIYRALEKIKEALEKNF
jgi:RNA polymerase sigma-70 factor (ECF subfamily)